MRGVGSHIDRRTGSGGTAGLRARASVLWLALMLMASAHAMVVRAVLALRQAAVFVACEAVAQQALRSLLNWNLRCRSRLGSRLTPAGGVPPESLPASRVVRRG